MPLPSSFVALQKLLHQDDVAEIMINGGEVFTERLGVMRREEIVLAGEAVEVLIERLLGPLGRRVDQSTPFADGRLPDGSRVHIAVAPAALDGPYVTIRRFRAIEVTLAELAAPPAESLLRRAVAERSNIVVSGATGAGKTTLLNALAGAIPRNERVITIEDAAELRLRHPHVVRLESRPTNAEGVGAISARELVRNALRMRPDRLIVGEVRGGEAFDMLQAMNTGHAGSMSTCHANGVADALRHVETMVLTAGTGLPLDAVRRQIGACINLVVHVARVADGQRRVTEIVCLEPAGEGWHSSSVFAEVIADAKAAP